MYDNLWERFNARKNYYNTVAYMSDIFEDDYEMTSQKCKEYIYKYFYRGGKPLVFDTPFRETYDQFGKHIHTVSLYFLGSVLRNLFCKDIYEGIKKALNSDIKWYEEEEEYEYTWFLTSLYHDVASCIETKIPYNASESVKHLEFYLGKSNIRYTPFNHQTINKGAVLNCYSEELIKNYFYYRSNKDETDHGIIGGYLLFDRLKKNLLEIFSKHHLDKEGVIKELDGRSLAWNIEYLDLFAYVADAIICHNLWTKNIGDDSEEYEKYGLDPLIIKNDSDKVSMKRLPLQFMLRLLDTIEPTKRFGDIPAKKVLENINISDYEKDNNRNYEKGIKIGWSTTLEKQRGFDKWVNPIRYLDKWMDVTVIEEKNNDIYSCIRIKFNNFEKY